MNSFSFLTQLSRRGGGFLSHRCQGARPVLARALSTKESGVDSGMPAGYGEFLDQMEEKTSKIESSVHALGETNAKKEQLHAMNQSVKWMDPEEMEFLFHLAAKQKQELQEQLTDLQRSLAAAKSNFAVDAPDGESDGHIEEEIDTVKQILAEHVAHVEQEKKCAEQRKAPNEWMSGTIDPKDCEVVRDALSPREKKRMSK